MAKAKSPKTTSTRGKNSVNKNDVNKDVNKNEKPNGAPTSGLDVQAAAEPATKAEKIAIEMSSHKQEVPKNGTEKTEQVPAPVTKATAADPLPTAAKDLEAAIRQRAYQIFLERRGVPGNPQEDWARAEREVREAFDHQKSA